MVWVFSINGALIQYQWRPHSVPMTPSFSTNCAPIQYQWRPHSISMASSFSINGALIQYQWRPHSVPMTPSFSTNGTLIQYQWRPHSVPIAPSFSINDDITVWASSCCMPFVVMSLFVIRCHSVIYVFVLRMCHSRPLPPSSALIKAVSRRRWVR